MSIHIPRLGVACVYDQKTNSTFKTIGLKSRLGEGDHQSNNIKGVRATCIRMGLCIARKVKSGGNKVVLAKVSNSFDKSARKEVHNLDEKIKKYSGEKNYQSRRNDITAHRYAESSDRESILIKKRGDAEQARVTCEKKLTETVVENNKRAEELNSMLKKSEAGEGINRVGLFAAKQVYKSVTLRSLLKERSDAKLDLKSAKHLEKELDKHLEKARKVSDYWRNLSTVPASADVPLESSSNIENNREGRQDSILSRQGSVANG